jgi:hypothetical protein
MSSLMTLTGEREPVSERVIDDNDNGNDDKLRLFSRLFL